MKLTLISVLLLLITRCFSQGVSSETSKDTINRIDGKKMKQGVWIFQNTNGSVRMLCTYKNDSILGSRNYYIDSVTTLERFPREDNKERFVLTKNSKEIKGWFDFKTSDIHSEAGYNIEQIDTSAQFLMGIPALYSFGKKNLMREVDKLLAPYANKLKGNKLVVEIKVDGNGIPDLVTVELQNSNKKLEGELKALFMKLDRWQPAFDTWNTQPYKKQIVITY